MHFVVYACLGVIPGCITIKALVKAGVIHANIYTFDASAIISLASILSFIDFDFKNVLN